MVTIDFGKMLLSPCVLSGPVFLTSQPLLSCMSPTKNLKLLFQPCIDYFLLVLFLKQSRVFHTPGKRSDIRSPVLVLFSLCQPTFPLTMTFLRISPLLKQVDIINGVLLWQVHAEL